MLARILAKDIQAHWVTKLLTLPRGSLGVLTVSSALYFIYILRSSEAYAQTDLKYGKLHMTWCDT